MYKVFFNDKCLIIAEPEEAKILNTEFHHFLKDTSEFNPGIVSLIMKCEYSEIVVSGDSVALWDSFCGLFRKIDAAGAVVQSNSGTLFIFRRGKWDLPKGKIDPGETPAMAALREVSEETGLHSLQITGELPSTWHVYPSFCGSSFDRLMLKETKWFLMEGNEQEELVPETAEDIETARWIKSNEIPVILSGTYASLKDLIHSLTLR